MRRWMTPYEREMRGVRLRMLRDLLSVAGAFAVFLFVSGSPAFRVVFRELPTILFIPLLVCAMIVFAKLFEHTATVIARRLR